MSDDRHGSDERAGGLGQAGSAGCAVDWSWLIGQQIVDASSDLQCLRLRLANGETLEVRAASWKGQPFLAFDPWRAAK